MSIRVLAGLAATASLALCACDDGPEPLDAEAFRQARQRAVQLDESGADPEAALEALLLVHEQSPEIYGINLRLARRYEDALQHERALHHYELALGARPEDGQARLRAVKLKERLEDLAGALVDAETLAQDESLKGEGLYHQALVLERLGRRDEALAALERAAPLDPRQAFRAAAMHGRMLLEDGRLDEAYERFESARRGRPDWPEALKGLADVSRRQGRPDEAARWDAVLQLMVSLKDDRLIHTDERADKRLDLLRRITDLYPDWVLGFRDLAEMQRDRGDRAGACATIGRLLEAHGDSMTADDARGLAARYCEGA